MFFERCIYVFWIDFEEISKLVLRCIFVYRCFLFFFGFGFIWWNRNESDIGIPSLPVLVYSIACIVYIPLLSHESGGKGGNTFCFVHTGACFVCFSSVWRSVFFSKCAYTLCSILCILSCCCCCFFVNQNGKKTQKRKKIGIQKRILKFKQHNNKGDMLSFVSNPIF